MARTNPNQRALFPTADYEKSKYLGGITCAANSNRMCRTREACDYGLNCEWQRKSIARAVARANREYQ